MSENMMETGLELLSRIDDPECRYWPDGGFVPGSDVEAVSTFLGIVMGSGLVKGAKLTLWPDPVVQHAGACGVFAANVAPMVCTAHPKPGMKYENLGAKDKTKEFEDRRKLL